MMAKRMFLCAVVVGSRGSPNWKSTRTNESRKFLLCPNELLKKPRIPEQTRTNQFYYLNIHRLSFAPRKHGFSINIAEKLFLEILVLHGGRTGTNQMTSNTKNSFNSGGGCRARVNLHSKFRKQRKPGTVYPPVLEGVNFVILGNHV